MILMIIVFVLLVFLAKNSNTTKGKVGEKIVASILEEIQGYKKIINNIMINDNGKSRQIDHILINGKGVFIIETKNYAGSIYGKENSNEWYQYLNNKKFNFKNPIFQNYAHKKIVSEILEDKINVIPIVVFTTRCKLKVENGNNIVLYTSQIKEYIQSQTIKLNYEKINEYYNIIMENRITNEETIKNHSDNVKYYVQYKNDLVNKNICPRCSATLIVKQGKYGRFIGCSNYPKCRYTKKI